MKTKLCNATKEAIREAARHLKNGELIAFPTETVYGLGANGLDEEAVAKIFLAKGRPQDNPLILHIADVRDLSSLVKSIPEKALTLVEAFWPGPLTIVLEASELVPKNVTAGGETVAVRMPSHPVALELIKEAGCPVAAPSANRSGRPSPTDAQTVWIDMEGRIPCILDGGSTRIGLESTVLDLTRSVPVILRPGFVTLEDVRNVIGPVTADAYLTDGTKTPRSPGQKYRHYAPKAALRLYEGEDASERMRKRQRDLRQIAKTAVLLLFEEDIQEGDREVFSLGKRADLSEMAHLLYKLLREADRQGADEILIPSVPKQGWGFAIMNRLEKAASGK